MTQWNKTSGGITAAKGYRAAGVAAGIKYPDRRDVAILISDQPAAAAAMFTTNAVAAAPVRLGRERLSDGRLSAVAVNTGYANACTGERGMRDARSMARMAARYLELPENEILVCSTGVIGQPLPMDRIDKGLRLAAEKLSPDGAADAAEAILTTDTVPKQAAVTFQADGVPITLGGMCKGAGMIEPHMATMLAFIACDATIAAQHLDRALREAVNVSFNRIAIDNDRSTNDTVLALANGAAQGPEIAPGKPCWSDFVSALTALCQDLARQIVMDGEGVSKFVTVKILGAVNDAEAQLAARAISRSMLVKTSWFGLDPNWGRVIAAVGYSGATVREEQTVIAYDGIRAFDRGTPATGETLVRLKDAMRSREFEVLVDLGLGSGKCVIWTCDLTREYVNINADYTT